MKRRSLVVLGALVLSFVIALPALAITKGGTLDGEDHPYVGLMVAYHFGTSGDPTDPPAGWRCSGTLVDEDTFVTAGHCTDGADLVWVWTLTDLEDPSPGYWGYPFGGGAVPPVYVTGTAYTYPAYKSFAFYLADLGVVKLHDPIALDRYAQLPTPDELDTLGKGRNNAVITAVGYGLQKAVSNPSSLDRDKDGEPDKWLPTPTDIAMKTRYQADLFVVNTQGVAGIGHLKLPADWLPTNSVILSGDAKHGGTCFGDSGGPGLINGDTLVAVNSFGLNGNCAGIGGMFRIDRAEEIAWINTFLP